MPPTVKRDENRLVLEAVVEKKLVVVAEVEVELSDSRVSRMGDRTRSRETCTMVMGVLPVNDGLGKV